MIKYVNEDVTGATGINNSEEVSLQGETGARAGSVTGRLYYRERGTWCWDSLMFIEEGGGTFYTL